MRESKGFKQWQLAWRENSQWTKFGWAAAVGISVGLAGAAFTSHKPASQNAAVTTPAPYVVPVSSTSPRFAAAEEHAVSGQTEGERMEQLKIRNRRLEALVSVLRRRVANRQ